MDCVGDGGFGVYRYLTMKARWRLDCRLVVFWGWEPTYHVLPTFYAIYFTRDNIFIILN